MRLPDRPFMRGFPLPPRRRTRTLTIALRSREIPGVQERGAVSEARGGNVYRVAGNHRQNIIHQRRKDAAGLTAGNGETRHSQTRLNAGTNRGESEKGKSGTALHYERIRLPRLLETAKWGGLLHTDRNISFHPLFYQKGDQSYVQNRQK